MSSANTRDASRKTYFLSNRTGSMKFVVPPADTLAIFPISVRFSEQVLSATLRGDNYDQYQVLYSISHETGQLK
nr:coatomer subunit delta-like isoform X1 [Tanacetum cinerariifolium]